VRVGIFGGTFDPPHHGHFLVAGDAYERLALDRLLFVPAGSQPLKIDAITATADQRLHMTRLMAEGDTRFEVDPVEIDRGGLSFTVDTLSALAERRPDDQLLFLFFVGADVLESFHKWREPERVARLAQIVVLRRTAGTAEERMQVAPDDATTGVVWPPPGVSDAVRAAPPPIFLETRRIDISSTEIRARVRAGRSIRGFVPEAVAEFIADSGLYR
jgi:nicotinate-nucleotide adenylyltransferase